MKFDDFDAQMRVYEQSLDQIILPDMYIVTRLDGRSFTRLTKEICKFKAPFDTRFRDMMIETVNALMQCGFRIIYGYTESDEISLLFHYNDNSFGRKVRKINTTLAGEASAAFSLMLGRVATFDCRTVPLPNKERVADYFMWRQEDSHRNSLNVGYKNELLFQKGINYNDLPSWQKRGIGIYFRDIEKEGYNPVNDEKTVVKRKELFADFEIPYGDEYRTFILNVIEKNKE